MPRMRWNCQHQGCFNIKRRPKIEVFDECFPGSIAFGDVDGIVEINGYFCLLEWKGDGGSLKVGQRILYERITSSDNFIVFVVDGDAETMKVQGYSFFLGGMQVAYRTATLADLKEQIRLWVKRVSR